MKKLFTLVLLAIAVLYFSPAANARIIHVEGKHKYSGHHHGAHKNNHKNAHKHLHGHRHGNARV